MHEDEWSTSSKSSAHLSMSPDCTNTMYGSRPAGTVCFRILKGHSYKFRSRLFWGWSQAWRRSVSKAAKLQATSINAFPSAACM